MRPKKTWRIIARVLEAVLLLLAILVIAVQMPSVQTRLVQEATSMLKESIDGKVEIGSIRLIPFRTVVIRDFTILDNEPMAGIDTLMHADRLSATFTLSGLNPNKKGGVMIDRLRTDGFDLYLVLGDRGEYTSNIGAVFHIVDSDTPPHEIPDLFSFRKVDITGFHFKMISTDEENRARYSGVGMNWADLDLTADVHGHDVNYVDSRMSFAVDKAALTEKSGYAAKFRGYCVTGMGSTEVTDFHLKDKWSDFNVESYTMAYHRLKYFKDFVNKVDLGGTFLPTVLAMKSLSYYTGVLQDCPLALKIDKGSVDGPVNGLSVKNLVAKDLYSGLELSGGCLLERICTPADASIDVTLRKLAFSVPTVQKLIGAFVPDSEIDLTQYAKDVRANLTGRIHGPINSLAADCRLSTNAGNLSLDATTDGLTDGTVPPHFDGEITAEELNIGRIIESDQIGLVSLHLVGNGTIRDEKDGGPEVNVKDLSISKLGLLGYEYTGISGNIAMKDWTALGMLKSEDPNMSFYIPSFGLTDCSRKDNSQYRLKCSMGNAVITYMDLKKTNLDKRDGRSEFSGEISSADLSMTRDSCTIGTVLADNLVYTDDGGDHNIGGIKLYQRKESGRYRVNMTSDFADFTFDGDRPIEKCISPVLGAIGEHSVPALFANGIPQTDGCHFKADLEFKDTKQVLAPLKMDLHLDKGSTASLEMGRDGSILGTATINKLAYNGLQFRGLALDMDADASGTRLKLGMQQFMNGSISLKDMTLAASAKDNGVDASAAVALADKDDTWASLNMQAGLLKSDNGITVVGGMHDSKLSVLGDMWTFSEPDILWNRDSLMISGLNLSSGEQVISVNGGYSQVSNQVLAVVIDNFQLSALNAFTAKDYGISGTLSGNAEYMTPAQTNAGLSGHLACPELKIGSMNAGSLEMRAWLDDEDDLVKFNLVNSNAGSANAIRISRGSFNMKSKYVKATANFNDFNIGIAQPFIEDYCDDLKGKLNGNITISGSPIKEDFMKTGIRCDGLTLSDGGVHVKPTGVSYALSGKVKYDAGGLLVSEITAKDPEDGRASVTGRLDNLKMHLDKLKILDKPESAGLFSGKLALDGDISFTGLGSQNTGMELDADLATSGSGNLNIETDFAESGNEVLLTFKEPVDTTEEEDPEFRFQTKRESSGSTVPLKVRCGLSVSPRVALKATLDKGGANIVTANGNGDISVDYDMAKGDLALGGGYTITEGNYRLNIMGLTTKNFKISNGSSVQFAGNPKDTEFDINAVYNTNATLGNLISDTTSVSTRRAVECGLNISNTINDPQLGFSIDIKDLDPATKAMVESELNTEDKVQKQFFALLATGSFISSETASYTESTAISGTNLALKGLASLASSQMSNILQKVGAPVDVGVSYQQNEIGKDIVDVAMSANLFKDRVKVTGSVGNRKYSSTSDDDVVGDLDILVKADRTGNLNFKMFSHSADDYTNFLDNSQRNGVGLTYQREYDNLKELFHKRTVKDTGATTTTRTIELK